MQSFMDTIKEILVSTLVEQWYWGIALAFIVMLLFTVLLENLVKAVGKPLTIVIGLIGAGLYVWLIVSLINEYTGFSVGLIAIAAVFIYFGYHAYFSKQSKGKKD